MNKRKTLVGLFAMAAAIASEQGYPSSPDIPISRKGKAPKPEPRVKPQKGQFHYWFRIDGTFLNEKQSERMLKTECVFTCFAINDKNAIKKFNKFIPNQNGRIKI